MVRLIVEGEAKEIAALVLELQGQQASADVNQTREILDQLLNDDNLHVKLCSQ